MEQLNVALQGAIGALMLAAGAFFLRFWRDGRDTFFLLFAASFLLEGVNRFGLALTRHPNEGAPTFYLVRLVSFVLILAAIATKNRKARG